MPADAVVAALGLKPGQILAGLLGALCAFPFLKDQSRWMRICSLLSGMALANYGTPFVGGWFDLAPDYYGLIGLACGIVGINIVAAIKKCGALFEKNPERFLKK